MTRETAHRSILFVVAVPRDQRFLLVLDNLEQVIDAAGDLADMLAACPGLAIQTTSRILARARGERALPVAPLGLAAAAVESESAAVLLFSTRASADGTGGGPEDSSAVVKIRYLRHASLLSIEFAAAWVWPTWQTPPHEGWRYRVLPAMVT